MSDEDRQSSRKSKQDKSKQSTEKKEKKNTSKKENSDNDDRMKFATVGNAKFKFVDDNDHKFPQMQIHWNNHHRSVSSKVLNIAEHIYEKLKSWTHFKDSDASKLVFAGGISRWEGRKNSSGSKIGEKVCQNASFHFAIVFFF